DIVHVKAGTYSENVVIDKPLTLRGENGAVIDAGTGVGVNITSDHVKVAGFKIRIGDKWDMRGIEVWGDQCNISYNQFELSGSSSYPGSPAIYLNSTNVFGLGNVVYGNTAVGMGYGLFADKSNQLKITKNDFTDCHTNGMRIKNSDLASICNNTVTGAKYSGIYLVETDDSNLSCNTLSECGQNGILLVRCSGNSLFRNNATDNGDSSKNAGIMIMETEGGELIGNTCTDNRYGTYLYESANLTLRQNTFIDNTYNFRVYGQYLYQFIHDVDESNTGDGKPILYLTDTVDETICSSEAGYIVLVSASQVTLKDLAIEGRYREGIMVAYSRDCTLENLTISGYEDGIYLRHSSGITVRNSNIHDNNEDGIFCRGGDNVTIEKNVFNGNKGEAVSLTEGTYYYIRENSISNNSGGIELDDSTHISVRDNNILSQEQNGIHLSDSTHNTIAGNTITNISSGILGGQGIYLSESEYNTLSQNNITGCEDAGIYLLRADYNTITGNTISQNKVGITVFVFLSTPVRHNTIEGNNIMGNTDYGLDATANNGGEVKAENNYWGAASGPTHSTNQDGTGDKVTDDVDFDPWLEEPVGGEGNGDGQGDQIYVPAWKVGQSWTWSITLEGDSANSSEVTERVNKKNVMKEDVEGNSVSCYEISITTQGMELGKAYLSMDTMDLINVSYAEGAEGAFFVSMYLSRISFPFRASDEHVTDVGEMEVEAGTFQAYLFEWSGNPIWYSPDVGHLIGLESGNIEAELISTDDGDDDDGYELPLIGSVETNTLIIIVVVVVIIVGLVVWLAVRPKDMKIQGYGIKVPETKEEKKRKKKEEREMKKQAKLMKKVAKKPGGKAQPSAPGSQGPQEPAQPGQQM
ncbi:MAG: right-handed parallel beta-helix repeat-containing protein, partial [Thermoplasmata archaeon]|nr:right-handed parallel beta-helix repeat-containing protein [Thermoplasmata archaeon]